MKRKIIVVQDKMQKGYRYTLAAPAGREGCTIQRYERIC